MDYNTGALILFVIIFSIIIFKYRSKIHFQPLLFTKSKYPLVYIALLRTQVGLKFMDKFAKRFSRVLKPLSTVGIWVGFIGMILVTFEILSSTITLFFSPNTAGSAALVLPIEAKGVVFVPFVIWILCLAIIIFVHEGGHGVIARLYDIKISSSGLAALGVLIPILPAAFVEPDEETLSKRPMKQQLAVFAAGPFANILLAVLLLPLLLFGVAPLVEDMYAYQGVTLNEVSTDAAYPISSSGLAVGAVISSLNGETVSKTEEFIEFLSTKKVGEEVSLVATMDGVEKSYVIALGEHPTKEGVGYMGVVAQTYKVLKNDTFWNQFLIYVYDFFTWLAILNLGIGLFNLLPIGIVDGGRMAKLVFEKYLREHHAKTAYATVSATCLFVVLFGVFVNVVS